MKKIFILLSLIYLSCSSIFAEVIKIGDFYYRDTIIVKFAPPMTLVYDTLFELAPSPDGDRYSGDIVIPTSVNYKGSIYSIMCLRNDVLAGCNNITSVFIPNSVTEIAYYAFNGCTKLVSIDVAADNTNYSSIDGVLFNKEKTTLLEYPEGRQGEYSIPNSVAIIKDHAFYNCTGLISVSIPNSITDITYGAFSFCTGLTSVTIPSSVTSIKDAAFASCVSLPCISIPSSVTNIGYHAFCDCKGLKFVTCEAIIPPTLDMQVFYNLDCSKIPLYVPYASVSTYKNKDQWKEFNPILPLGSQVIETIISPVQSDHKEIKDGQIYILRGDKTYTLQGQELK